MAQNGSINVSHTDLTVEWILPKPLGFSNRYNLTIDSPNFTINHEQWYLNCNGSGAYYSDSDYVAIYLQSANKTNTKCSPKMDVEISIPECAIRKPLQLSGTVLGIHELCTKSQLKTSSKILCRIVCDEKISKSKPKAINSKSKKNDCEEGLLIRDLQFLFKEPKLSDVSIIVGTEKLPAHKVILAARSPVFSAMFENDGTLENIKNEVMIENMEPDVIKAMLEFFYTDEVTNLAELACGLLEAANKYDVPGLRRMCDDVLYGKLNDENAAELLIVTDLHRSYALKSHILNFMAKRIVAVSESESFQVMEKDCPELLKDLLHSIIAVQKSKK